MDKKTLHIVSHSHWDREWYLPLENFRMRLVDLIDHLLDILEADAGYRFHLDAQTIVLDEADITNVAVRPQYRRQGIGLVLVQGMLEMMQAVGVRYVLLEVRESNLPAQNCYARAGFVPVGRRKKYYELPKEDALLMGRQLL